MAHTSLLAPLSATPDAAAVSQWVLELLDADLGRQSDADCALLSIACGVLESPAHLARSSCVEWPSLQELVQRVEALHGALEAWVAGLAAALAGLAPPPSARDKVKAVADAVWGKLTGSFSKDTPHVQHLASLAALLLPGGAAAPKRLLDCAGVATSCVCACRALAARHGHADRASATLQVSEDHGWVQLAPEGGREGAVEVTTADKAKRGQAPTPAAWAGWIYAHGRGVLCSPRQLLAAVAASINPAVTKKEDSEALQALQAALLARLHAKAPDAAYPAATCSLADLYEVGGWGLAGLHC